MCAVFGCKNNDTERDRLSFHKFLLKYKELETTLGNIGWKGSVKDVETVFGSFSHFLISRVHFLFEQRNARIIEAFFEFDWRFYVLSASKAIFRVKTYCRITNAVR